MASVTLYHSVESTCAQKVRLVLAEKQLPWEERRINLRKGEQFSAEYLKLNPKAVVPTLVHDGRAIRESSVINEYLDEVFPDPVLIPADAMQRANMRLLVKTFDEEVHPAVGILTYAIVLRHQMNALKSPQELAEHFEKIVDPGRRERQRGTHERGLQSPAALPALQTLDRVIGAMEASLSESSWLAADCYSLADAAATPYMVRVGQLGLGSLWRSRPRVSAWLACSTARENCGRLDDPWGGRDFTEMVAEHVQSSGAEIETALGALA